MVNLVDGAFVMHGGKAKVLRLYRGHDEMGNVAVESNEDESGDVIS